MDAKIFRVNYKSDFILTLISDAGWMTPFCIKFWTGAPSQAYYVQYDGTTYTNCAPVAGEPTKLTVQFDDHHMPIGNLKYQVAYHFTVADFPNDTEDEVLNQANITTEIDGETYQVMLDFTGETAPEIQFSLPAYANEAQRIANELQREANELQREANEEDREDNELNRQRNEGTRIENERERVQEFQQMKGELEQATRDASAAAENANEKAVYAKNQGDYAKQQGDYAKDQGDIAKADHLRAEEDHRVAGEDHTQAGNDHTRAGEDHTQAGNDHTRAGEDHTQAGNDHTRAGEDHTRAESDHAAVEVYVDSLGVFDLSKHNAVGGVLATYADLNAALTALNALESKYKYGGMSLKYVQSSDNKYVQARLMADSFTTDVTKWQCSIDEVKAGSKDLVESGAVAKSLSYSRNKEDSSLSFDDDEIDISDNEENPIVKINNNGVYAKEFFDLNGNKLTVHKNLLNKSDIILIPVEEGNLSPSVTWWDNHGIDINTGEVIEKEGSKVISGFITIEEAGQYQVWWKKAIGYELITNQCNFVGYDEHGDVVWTSKNITKQGQGGNTITIFKSVVNQRLIIRKYESFERYGIKTIKIEVPNTVNDIVFKKYVGDYKIIESKRELFEQISNNYKNVNVEWFAKDVSDYSDTERIQRAIEIARKSFGSTIIFPSGEYEIGDVVKLDDNEFSLNCNTDTHFIGLANDGNQSYQPTKRMFWYLGSHQSGNMMGTTEGHQIIFDYNGIAFSGKPYIIGGIIDGNICRSGILVEGVRGLSISRGAINNCYIGLEIKTENWRCYETVVSDMRFIVDRQDVSASFDSTAMLINAMDQHFVDIVITDYKHAINDMRSSNRYCRVHGWVGYQLQVFEGSSFMHTTQSSIIDCYCDTYDEGFDCTNCKLCMCNDNYNTDVVDTPPIHSFVGCEFSLCPPSYINN